MDPSCDAPDGEIAGLTSGDMLRAYGMASSPFVLDAVDDSAVAKNANLRRLMLRLFLLCPEYWRKVAQMSPHHVMLVKFSSVGEAAMAVRTLARLINKSIVPSEKDLEILPLMASDRTLEQVTKAGRRMGARITRGQREEMQRMIARGNLRGDTVFWIMVTVEGGDPFAIYPWAMMCTVPRTASLAIALVALMGELLAVETVTAEQTDNMLAALDSAMPSGYTTIEIIRILRLEITRDLHQDNTEASTAARTVMPLFLKSVFDFLAQTNCRKCGAENCTKRCGQCGAASYCSAECQKTHWTLGKHRNACKVLRILKMLLSSMTK